MKVSGISGRGPRLVAAVFLLCLAAGWIVAGGGQQPVSLAAPYVPGEVLVKFRRQAPTARRNALLAARSAHLLRKFDAIDIHHLRLLNGSSVEAATFPGEAVSVASLARLGTAGGAGAAVA